MSRATDGKRARPWWWRLFFYAKPPESLRERDWQLLGLLGATFLINNYDLGILGLALPQIQAGLAIPETEVGRVTGVIRLGVLPALALTMLADVVGRRRLLLLTILGFTVCTFATAFARDSTDFMVLQFAARMFIYAEEMLAIVVVAEELDARARGYGLGILAAFGALGHGVAALFYSTVEVVPYGWRALYVVGLAPLLVLAWMRRNLSETRRFLDHRTTRAPIASVLGYLRPVRDLLTMYPTRLLLLLSAIFPFWFFASSALQFQSKYLQESHGYAPGNVTLLFVFGGFFAIVGNVVAGAASDRFGRRFVLTSALAVNASATWLFYNIAGAFIPPAWCLMIFAYFGTEVLFAALGTELFPTSYRSTASGARAIIGAVGGGLGLWFEGWAYTAAGGHAAAISWMLIAALIPPLVILLFVPETSARELEEIAPERA